MDANIANSQNELRPVDDSSLQPSPIPTGDDPVENTPIPWELRRQIGWILAFWKTVAWVLARNGRIGKAMGQPVDWYSARSFRAACVRWAMLFTLVAAFCSDTVLSDRGLLVQIFLDLHVAKKEGLIVLAALAIALAIYRGMAGIVSWLFCPRKADIRTQNRAIALSCYLCAPLVLLALPIMVLSLMHLKTGDPIIDSTAVWASVVIVMYWAQVVVCGVWSVLGGRVWRAVVSAMVLVISWAVWVAAVGAVPLAVILWLWMAGFLI